MGCGIVWGLAVGWLWGYIKAPESGGNNLFYFTVDKAAKTLIEYASFKRSTGLKVAPITSLNLLLTKLFEV